MSVNSIFCFILIASIFSCKHTQTESEVLYYGTDSRRAKMTFKYYLKIKIPSQHKNNPSAILSDSDLVEELIEDREYQLSFMYGAFTQHEEPFNFLESPGIPRNQPSLKWDKVEDLGNGYAKIYYDYSDIVVFKKSLFFAQQNVELNFRLPSEPNLLYPKGMVAIDKGINVFQKLVDQYGVDTYYQQALTDIIHHKDTGATQINMCTDLHYNGLDDFWYFWNPAQEGCPALVRQNTNIVKATLDPMNSTAKTYPNYTALYGDNENGDTFEITYLVGVDENFGKEDLGKLGFKKALRLLTEGKDILTASDSNALLTDGEKKLFAEVPDSEDIKFSVDSASSINYKKLTYDAGDFKVVLNMYLINPNSDDPFVGLATNGLQNSDVFIYDGHSGLGGYLSVGRLFYEGEESLPVDKYQILFFNGCSTFSYYNYDFFQQKVTADSPKGEKRLDILTTGIGAPFNIGPGSDVWLIRHLISKKRPTWQKIVDTITFISPMDSALTHINGDINRKAF